jgi:tetratricopeptide (TPR) repeat protein
MTTQGNNMTVQGNQNQVELKRLAKLRWKQQDGEHYGSGYLVAPAVVLTAAHVVEGTNQLEVRLDPSDQNQRWYKGEVIWRGRHDTVGVDLALVRLEVPSALPKLVHFADLGRGINCYQCSGVGFPDYKFRSDVPGKSGGVRDTVQLEGELRLGSNLVLGQWELQLNQNPFPNSAEGNSPWPGISGTAVLVGGCIVGVVIIHPTNEGTGVLQVQPIHPVLSQPDFCQALTGEQRPLYWHDPWGLLQPPYKPLPAGAEQSPAVLLRPEFGVVPFEGRETELQELQAWLEDEPPFRLGLVLGQGGSGKTRLTSELADQVGRVGWLAGWLPAPGESLKLELLETHLASGLKLLLLLDEAHWRKADDLVVLLRRLTENSSTAKCRLVLLARTDRDWWPQLEAQTVDAVPAHLAVKGAFKRSLDSLVPYLSERQAAYQRAFSAFAQALQPLRSAGQSPTLAAQDYHEILMVQAEALLAVLGENVSGGNPNSLWDELLVREQNYWLQRREPLNHVLSNERQQLSELVGLGTLAGAQDWPTAQAVLSSLSWLKEADAVDCRKADEWLKTLYPGQKHWPPLKPDRFADALLAQLLVLNGEFTESLTHLAQQASEAQLTNSLSVLSRMSCHYPEGEAAIDRLLAAAPQKLLRIPITMAPQAGDPLGKGIERLLQRQPLDPEQAEGLVSLLPQKSVVLARTAVTLTQGALAGYNASEIDETRQAKRANLLNALSVRLSDVGDRQGALAAIQEAVVLHRELVQRDPDTFTPDLAKSLNTLSNSLSDVGERLRALDAIQEAVALYRPLAKRDPDAFTPNLAGSLNNLWNRLDLSDVDERPRAWDAIQESVKLYRSLAQRDPDAFTPDLAMSFNNLSIYLLVVDERPRALDAIQESVKLYRSLAQRDPDVFTPDLAESLNALSSCLSVVDQLDDALQAGQESVELYRSLAQRDPDVFTPDLANSLNTLSVRLSDVGERRRALDAIQKSVKLYRPLAQRDPDAFTPDLANSLNNLSNRLSAVAQLDDALQARQESVELYRVLASSKPRVFQATLANSLDTVARVQSQLGHQTEAFGTIQEAIAIVVALLQQDPQVHAELADTVRTSYLQLCEQNHVAEDPALLTALQTALPNSG